MYWWVDNISTVFNVVFLKGNEELKIITDGSKLSWGSDLGVSSIN